MEVSLHHVPKLLKVEPKEYVPGHPLYEYPKITSDDNHNLLKLEKLTQATIEIDQTTAVHGISTILLKGEDSAICKAVEIIAHRYVYRGDNAELFLDMGADWMADADIAAEHKQKAQAAGQEEPEALPILPLPGNEMDLATNYQPKKGLPPPGGATWGKDGYYNKNKGKDDFKGGYGDDDYKGGFKGGYKASGKGYQGNNYDPNYGKNSWDKGYGKYDKSGGYGKYGKDDDGSGGYGKGYGKYDKGYGKYDKSGGFGKYGKEDDGSGFGGGYKGFGKFDKSKGKGFGKYDKGGLGFDPSKGMAPPGMYGAPGMAPPMYGAPPGMMPGMAMPGMAPGMMLGMPGVAPPPGMPPSMGGPMPGKGMPGVLGAPPGAPPGGLAPEPSSSEPVAAN